MINRVLKFRFVSFFLLMCLLFTTSSLAQLSNFNFNVTKTNESCLANGSMTFVVSNTISGSTIDYKVYLLPNSFTPLFALTANTLTGLNAGNYRVIATQSLNGNTGTQQVDLTITNVIVPFNYSLIPTTAVCGNDGKITVNVTSGIAVNYEILTGPVLVAGQTSNVFNNLPPGIYKIRVTNNCGEGVVQTYTLQGSPPNVIIGQAVLGASLPSCTTVTATNSLSVSGGSLVYPLQVQYTIFPPSGAPIIQNTTVNAGSSLSVNLPLYNGQSYLYNIKVTDNCGYIYTLNNNSVTPTFSFSASAKLLNCTDKELRIIVSQFVAPFTIAFTNAPSGFNPNLFNNLHPGPFNTSQVVYGGIGNDFPQGNYTIVITDSCGRQATQTINTVINLPLPSASGFNDGCQTKVSVTIATPLLMTSVILTAAPSGYLGTLPQNLTSSIISNTVVLSGVPLGSYTFQVIDSCGITNTAIGVVGPFTVTFPSYSQYPGCDVGFGTAVINSTPLSEVLIISAPTTYTGTLPLNITTTFLNGKYYMGNLPTGNYFVKVKTICGAEVTGLVFVSGYSVTNSTIGIVENCGSFNLSLAHQSNGSFQQVFCLQKLNPITGQWGHPLTGSVYATGTALTTINSLFLTNNASALNLAYSGNLRVMKSFGVYNSSGDVSLCISPLKEFFINGLPKITDVYTFACSNNSKDIIVIANGVAPLTYKITTKNGLPFLIDNANSNTFSGLSPAVYSVQVQDNCGNVVNSFYDVTSLPSFTITPSAFCNGQSSSLSVPNLSFLNYRWWKGNATTITLSTTSQLVFPNFSATNDIGVYHVQITNPTNITSCINSVIDYTIVALTSNPNAGLDNTSSFCGTQGQIDLFTLIGTHDANGTWTETTNSGTLINNLWNTSTVASGNYEFKYKVNGSCATFDEAIVKIAIKSIPNAPIASVNNSICESQSINLSASTISGANYSWTGPNGFTSSLQNPVILNSSTLNNGIYKVKVTLNGCSSVENQVSVTLNSIPKFSLTTACLSNVFSIISTPELNSFNPSTVNYSWNGPNSFSSNLSSVQLNGMSSGSYSLTISDPNGCSTSKSIEITGTACQIQTGISPNGDANNDNFDLTSFNVEKLKIFNRYGMTVYEQDNYSNQWNGLDLNGNELPSATYFYTFRKKTGESRTGWIYLLR